MQIYVYHLCFPKDYWRIQFTVYGLYFLDIIQTVLTTQGAWRALCSGWGSPSSLIHTTWGFAMIPVASGIISSWVQIFFASRIWILGQTTFWRGITLITIAVSLAQAAAAIGTGIKFLGINNTLKISEVNSLVTVWLSGSVAADVLIAVSMIYFLVSAKGRSMWRRRTNKRITKLIRSTVETGAVSAAAASIELGLYLGFNQNNLHTVIAFGLSKLYTNALMASLNSRAGVYERSLPTSTASGEETYPNSTSGYFNTVQFTSVGVGLPMTAHTSDTESGKTAHDDQGPGSHGDRKTADRMPALRQPPSW